MSIKDGCSPCFVGTRAFGEGEQAYADGMTAQANPYPDDTDESDAWVVGWQEQKAFDSIMVAAGSAETWDDYDEGDAGESNEDAEFWESY